MFLHSGKVKLFATKVQRTINLALNVQHLPGKIISMLLGILDMKTYQDNKEGDRTSPEFEREAEFFIPVDVFLLEIECPKEKSVTAFRVGYYIREDLDKEGMMCDRSVKEVLEY